MARAARDGKHARRRPYLKWCVDKFLDKDSGELLATAYQDLLKDAAARVRVLVVGGSPTGAGVAEMAAAVLAEVVVAADAVVGRKRVVPGRTRAWWSAELSASVRSI